MPRDLFGDVIAPSIKLGSRKWYSVPLSFTAHAAALSALIVAPLVATGALPMPQSGPLVIQLTPPPLPSPPPVQRATPPPRVNRNAAPVVAPDTVAPEAALPDQFEHAGAELGIDDIVTIESTAPTAPPPAPVKVEPPAPTTVRPGGVIKAPERVSYVAPIYPPVALAARVRGMVVIEAVIDTAGRVQDARVLRSDSPLLNDAALSAVRQWTYTPTLLNGVPVSVIMTVTVRFQMQ